MERILTVAAVSAVAIVVPVAGAQAAIQRCGSDMMFSRVSPPEYHTFRALAVSGSGVISVMTPVQPGAFTPL